MKLKRLLIIGIMAVSVLAISGCKSNSAEETSKSDSETEEATEDSAAQEEEQTDDYMQDIAKYGLPQLEEPEDGEVTATISTNKGDITVRFFEEQAPKAVENFLGLAEEGYYDGVIFHRVINNFMIQGGDPTGTGTGGESYFGEDFGLEISTSLRHFRGALAMANTGQPNSNGSQFYIVQQTDIGQARELYEQLLNSQDEEIQEGSDIKVSDVYPPEVCNEYLNNGGSPSLDGSYTVFGQVIDGMDVVDAIAAVETDDNDKPVEDVVINSVTINR